MDDDEFEGWRTMNRRAHAGRYGWNRVKDFYTDWITRELLKREAERWERMGVSSSAVLINGPGGERLVDVIEG
jgi:hypothetical protein